MARYEEQREKIPTFTSPPIVAGHSLGAAIALLYASERKVEGIYLFACPKTGTDSFVRKVEEGGRVWRIQNRRDLVTKIPLGLSHAGEEIRLDFDAGSVVGNHILPNYISVLQKAHRRDGGGETNRLRRRSNV